MGSFKLKLVAYFSLIALLPFAAAFSGLERMHAAYRHAIAAGYRFYSYGDACLLERSAAA